MYICDKHGKIDDWWCDKCEKSATCDCSDIEKDRIKDLHYGEKDWCFKIYVEYCATCGDIKSVDWQ